MPTKMASSGDCDLCPLSLARFGRGVSARCRGDAPVAPVRLARRPKHDHEDGHALKCLKSGGRSFEEFREFYNAAKIDAEGGEQKLKAAVSAMDEDALARARERAEEANQVLQAGPVVWVVGFPHGLLRDGRA